MTGIENVDNLVKEFGLNETELADFSSIISSVLIPKLIQMADKYNIDRDSMIKFTANTLNAMSEVTTFKNYGKGEKHDY